VLARRTKAAYTDRTVARLSFVVALALVPAAGRPARAGAPAAGRQAPPDLDRLRFRMPRVPRRIWTEIRAGGAYLPAKVTDLPASAATAYGTVAWTLALARRIAAHAGHTLAVYRAGDVTLQGSEHDLGVAVEVADGRLGRRPARAFLDLGAGVHVLKRSWVDGRLFKFGGLWDTVAGIGLAVEHDLGRRVRLGWRLDGRWVWVFTSTQRQARAAVRVETDWGRGHTFGLVATGYLVHRDRRQFGRRFPRVGGVGQAEVRYGFQGRRGVGPVVRVRYTTGFRSGEAPVYEVRAETLTRHYADVWVGIAASF